MNGVPIAEVLVREGDTVAKGAPLVRLDTRGLQLEVDAARAGLAQTHAAAQRANLVEERLLERERHR
jgi:multidrug efflux pump subunit AcrA (membrane-fusion protein)